MSLSFQQRLKKVMAGGNLRVADLARWFERPHSTVTSWVNDGWEPAGGPDDKLHIEHQMKVLEAIIIKKKKLPMPRLSPKARIAYLGEIRQMVLL